MSEEKLRVFGITCVLGDQPYLLPLLNQAFENFDALQARLAAINVDIEPEPLKQVVDQATQLLVRTHGLDNKEHGWELGCFDLVEADDERYQQLLASVKAVSSESSYPLFGDPQTDRDPLRITIL